MADNNYVYFHLTPSGDVFYVGMGYGDRAREKDSRNKYWHNTVKKHGGYTINYVHENLSVAEAFELEKKYIAQFGRKKYDPNGILVNLAEGGQGNRGFRKTYLMQPVTAIDYSGNVVGSWGCMEDVLQDGYSREMVWACMNGRKRSHKNMVWVPSAHATCKVLVACLIASATNLKKYPVAFRERMKVATKDAHEKGMLPQIHAAKRVAAFLNSGGYIGTFRSTTEASNELGISPRHVSSVARGEKNSRSFKLRYI